MPALELNNLTRRFGDFVAVNNVSLQIKQGAIYGFLGPNGSGKSTTIRMLCGLLEPTSGSGKVLGLDIAKDSEALKQKIGYSPSSLPRCRCTYPMRFLSLIYAFLPGIC